MIPKVGFSKNTKTGPLKRDLTKVNIPLRMRLQSQITARSRVLNKYASEILGVKKPNRQQIYKLALEDDCARKFFGPIEIIESFLRYIK